MNKFKNIIRKIPKIIWFLVATFVVFRITIEIPALPYNLNFLNSKPPNLDNHKILYTDSFNVYLKTYSNGKAEKKIILYGKNYGVSAGAIFGDNNIFILEEDGVYIYSYTNNNLKYNKILDTGTVGDHIIYYSYSAKIDENNFGIFYEQYTKPGGKDNGDTGLRVKVVNIHNLEVSNDFITNDNIYELPFVIENTYKVGKTGDNKIFFEESSPKLLNKKESIWGGCLIPVMGGAMGCSAYRLYTIGLIYDYGQFSERKVILDKSTDVMIMDKGERIFQGFKLSANKDFVIYSTVEGDHGSSDNDVDVEIYAISVSSGRKTLIDSKPYMSLPFVPLYME